MSTIITRIAANCRLIELNAPLSHIISPFSTSKLSFKPSKVDKSRVPVINEKELKEEFIHGSGPGGQNVNKLSNCVQLTHLPTGIVVKCHQNREQHRNRVVAREILRDKLDQLMNGDNSVAAQRHRLITDRFARRNKKREKLRELKSELRSHQESEESQQKLSPKSSSELKID